MITKEQALRALSRLEEAISVLHQIRGKAPYLVWACNELGDLLRRLGRNDEALEALDQALKLQPENAYALGTRGMVLRDLGRCEEAVEMFRAVLRFDPTLAPAHTELGETLRQLGRNDEALEALDQALKLQPENAYALGTRGMVLRDLGRCEEAVEMFRAVLRFDPTLAPAHTELGETLRQLGRNDEALEALDQALKLQPENAYALGTRGQVLLALKRHQEAVEALRKAMETNPKLDWAHADLGEALRQLGRNDEALEALDQALKLQPENAYALGTRGKVLRDLGRCEEAVEMFRAVLRFDPTLAPAHTELGETLRQLGRNDEALEALDQALKLQPENAYALGIRGRVLRSLNRHEEGIEALRKALEIDPKLVWARSQLTETLGSLGRHLEAAAEFDRILAIDRSNLDARLGLSAILCQLNYVDEALELLEPLDRDERLDSKQWAFALARRGQALCAMGRFDEAAQVLQQAIAHDDTIDWYHALYGWAMEGLRRGSEAELSYRKAMEKASLPDSRVPTAFQLIPTRHLERSLDQNWRKGVANGLYLESKWGEAKLEYQGVIDTVTSRVSSPDADTLSLLGWCYFRLDDFDKALRHLKQAVSLNPTKVSTHFDVALVLLCLKRDELAMREYARAMEATSGYEISRRRGIYQVAINDLKATPADGQLSRSAGADRANRLLEDAQNQTLELLQEIEKFTLPRAPIHRDLRLARHRLSVPEPVRGLPQVLRRRARSHSQGRPSVVLEDCRRGRSGGGVGGRDPPVPSQLPPQLAEHDARRLVLCNHDRPIPERYLAHGPSVLRPRDNRPGPGGRQESRRAAPQ